jgi:hypothetical protein
MWQSSLLKFYGINMRNADELAHVLRTFTPIIALFSLSFYTNSLKRTVLSFV